MLSLSDVIYSYSLEIYLGSLYSRKSGMNLFSSILQSKLILKKRENFVCLNALMLRTTSLISKINCDNW